MSSVGRCIKHSMTRGCEGQWDDCQIEWLERIEIATAEPITLRDTIEPPCTLDVQVTLDHELEFHFDATGHVSKVICSCGAQGTVQML